MENKQSVKAVPSASSLHGWLDICIGSVLAILALVGATTKTYVGAFIVYVFAFLFGMLYPFVLALIFVFGLHLAIARKARFFDGKPYLYAGFALVFIGLLSFASYSIILNQNGTDFSSLNPTYLDRMSAFARSPFQIDSFESLSGLGGGYLGLFFLTLLGAVWGSVGDAVFYSFVLVIGLVLLLFPLIRKFVSYVKEKKARKVRYSSPYQPSKGKVNPHLNRYINGDEKESGYVPEPEPEPVKKPSPKITGEFDNSWSGMDQGSFSSADGSTYTPSPTETYENNISVPEDSFRVAKPVSKPSQTPVEEEQEEEEESSFTPDVEPKPVAPITPAATPAPVSEPVEETKDTTQAVLQPATEEEETSSTPIDDEVSRKAQEFSDNARSKDANTIPVKEEEPEEKTVKPVVNPLTQVVPSSSKKVIKPMEYQVESASSVEETPVEEEPEEEPAPQVEEKELTEEEIEEKKEAEYFARKQQREAEKLLARKREKDQKLASLMKYVSSTEQNYDYPLPNDSLLEEIDDSAKVEKNSIFAQEKASVINKVFDEFGVKAKATSFTIGASVTRFNIETEHGEKADKIANLTSEFQRALNGDMSVRVETVVEGRSTSGIEVGNVAPMAVSFKDMFEAIEQDTSSPLLLPIGKDISGNIITFPLNKMPHLLVAGTTGSGKSVLIHSMIMTLIMRTYPSQVKLMLIDPKQVEFIRYQDCSHLFCPVISKPESAILALKKLCQEMDRRFSVLSKVRCANLEDYQAYKIAHPKEDLESMPYIVTIIDEFADLMQTGGNEVTRYVTRIAQKARACGIHLIIATQRPSKDNVPMIIKANVPCRIGLSVSSQIDSRVILDENGAETLLGKGDLLFKCPGKKSLIRCQSPFISNKDIDTVLTYVKQRAGHPNYDPEFLDLDVEEPSEEPEEGEHDLYDDIKDFVVHTGITSKTSIMRSFQVSSLKADQYLAKLTSESIIALGPNGKYVLGPAAHLEDFE